MIIVTNHWKEDMEWLKNSKFPVVMVDKEGSAPSCFTPWMVLPNKGGAESSYFKFIIENYHKLPDHIAFLHGHETAYHQKHERPLLEVIEGANLAHGYIPLNGWVRFYNFQNEEGVMDLPKLWDDFKLPAEIKPPLHSIMSFQPNSQFIVSRERICRFSKELYEHMYNVMLTEEPEICPYVNKPIGRHYALLENIFHIMYAYNTTYYHDPTWFNFEYTPCLWEGHTPEEKEFIETCIKMNHHLPQLKWT
jgi:hypothetical protein